MRRDPVALALAPLVLAAALPVVARPAAGDSLRLVPPDAAVVGVLRLSDLKASPLGASLFADMDRLAVEGDAARFLEETHLRPMEDVDTVVLAASPGPEGNGRASKAFVAFEGRFEPDRLAAAVTSRGALLRQATGGDYYLLRNEKHPEKDGSEAIAFVDRHLVLAGTEAAVVDALAARRSGGTGFVGGAGLGRQMSRVDSGATGWLLVDRTRFPQLDKVDVRTEGDNPAGALVMAVKTVQTFVFQMTAKGDSLRLSASGLSADDETRELLEDAMRGVLAATRLAMQEKPDVVSVLRKFKVTRDREAVTVAGTLPGEAVRAIAERRKAARAPQR